MLKISSSFSASQSSKLNPTQINNKFIGISKSLINARKFSTINKINNNSFKSILSINNNNNLFFNNNSKSNLNNNNLTINKKNYAKGLNYPENKDEIFNAKKLKEADIEFSINDIDNRHRILSQIPRDPYSENPLDQDWRFKFQKPKNYGPYIPFEQEEAAAITKVASNLDRKAPTHRFNYTKPDFRTRLEKRRDNEKNDSNYRFNAYNVDPFLSAKPMDLKGTILYERQNYYLLMYYNRPRHLNTLSLYSINALLRHLRGFSHHPHTRAIIFRGSGNKVFCAGRDWATLYHLSKEGRHEKVTEYLRQEYKLAFFAATYGKFNINILNGASLGSGIPMALNANYTIATASTSIGSPETALGGFPDVGVSFFFGQINNKYDGLGTYMSVTGASLKGEDLAHLGFCTHFMPLSSTSILLHELSNSRDTTMENIFKILQLVAEEARGFSLSDQIKDLTNSIKRCFGSQVPNLDVAIKKLQETIDSSYTSEQEIEWAKRTLKRIRFVSPIGAKLAFRNGQLATNRGLGECMRMDYRANRRCLNSPDFIEGVRASLIDRDMKPKWSYARAEDVPEELIDSYFEPLTMERDKDCDLIMPEGAHLEDALYLQYKRFEVENPELIEVFQ